ncbi:MAG: geranylgeranylglyceryl/heptaprenylglyceryl phosphate synthase [Bacteroidetes bacterium]|nr:MAG: geranylgeranylglyceryl/heptaprenylglyceryl phosphate synthase [Bacteroidota bacterium]
MQDILYQKIKHSSTNNFRQLAILIDPDKVDEEGVIRIAELVNHYRVDYIFTGGSLITCDFMSTCIQILKETVHIPVIIFPGNPLQVHAGADAILLLSLISGRNPELLIGNHVIAAPVLKKSGLEILPTGYMLVESGRVTSVVYMSNTTPIPFDKPDIASCTAMAGEMLGLKLIYMDAGSGASIPVSPKMIKRVKASIRIPLIVGGGIRTAIDAAKSWVAGADIVVVGNATESEPSFIAELCKTRDRLNETTHVRYQS